MNQAPVRKSMDIKLIPIQKITIIITILCLIFHFAGAQTTPPTGLEVNQQAPDFTAKDQDGKIFNLKSNLKNGPVIVLFYRGQWCPFCNKQLHDMQDSLGQIKSKGATVVAITPEKPENISKTIEKTKASYSILFDDGLKIMNSYKVAFQIEGAMVEKYKSYGIDFTQANGSNGAYLPIPAVYVIDKKGKIIYRHFDPDYHKRPSVKEIASHL